MTRPKRRLRRAFDKAERAIGEPLEEIVASKSYTEAMLKLFKARKAISGAIAGKASGMVEKLLHLAQIPTRSDVRSMNRHIADLSAEVRTLSGRLQAGRAVVASPKEEPGSPARARGATASRKKSGAAAEKSRTAASRRRTRPASQPSTR